MIVTTGKPPAAETVTTLAPFTIEAALAFESGTKCCLKSVDFVHCLERFGKEVAKMAFVQFSIDTNGGGS